MMSAAIRLVGFAVVAVAAAGPANAAAIALPTNAPAKGEKSCLISQLTSEFLEKQKEQANAKAGLPFYMQTMSYFKFRVHKSGEISVGMSEDIYPGSKFYFLIDGNRYSGAARFQLPLDAKALAALKQEKLIDFTYTVWPYRNEVSRKDIFTGFTKAYEECRRFMTRY